MSQSNEVTLAFFRSDGERKDFTLVRPVTTLGRARKTHLRIPLRSVSRLHAQIEVREDGVFIRDLGSSNGTRINGKRVVEARLKPGDRISLGWAHFVVVINGKPAKIDPIPTVRPDSAQWKDGEGARPEAIGLDDEPEGQGPVMLAPASDLYDVDEEDPISALEALSSQEGWKLKPKESEDAVDPEDSSAPAAQK